MSTDFKTRLAAVREELERRNDSGEKLEASGHVEEQLFHNGWPNCWGSFNNIMP